MHIYRNRQNKHLDYMHCTCFGTVYAFLITINISSSLYLFHTLSSFIAILNVLMFGWWNIMIHIIITLFYHCKSFSQHDTGLTSAVLAIHLSVCPSITCWYCTKMAKHRITLVQGLLFSDAKYLHKVRTGSPPTGVPNAGGVGYIGLAIIRKWHKIGA